MKAQGLVSWQFWMDCCSWHPLVVEQVLDACWRAVVALQTQQRALACSWVWWWLLEVQVAVGQGAGAAWSAGEGGAGEGAVICRSV